MNQELKTGRNNSSLGLARKMKKDEFYTELIDIEKELVRYRGFFKNKVVYCNCDDFHTSNFFLYFFIHFKKLGLKKLIASCYKKQEMNLFDQSKIEKAFFVECTKGGSAADLGKIKINYFKRNGDFRSRECVDLLRKSDVVVTNPPFSLFRPFFYQLMQYKKQFILITNITALARKKIFSCFADGRVRLGHSLYCGGLKFKVPDDYLLNTKLSSIEDGEKYIQVGGVRWITTFEYQGCFCYDDLVLTEKYNSKKYLKYNNYDAINVDKVKEIPFDYSGKMGVPITFLDKYNPEQFELVGLDSLLLNGGDSFFNIGEKNLFIRVVIKNKKCE